MLRYLELVDQNGFNTRPLESLSNLRGLRIDSPGAGIDFSWFPKLEVFIGDWHVDNCNLGYSRELRKLRIWQFKPRSPDLTEFMNIPRLETLEITKTSISSLAGVERMEDLRYLEIAYAPKLLALDSLSFENCGIRELELEHVRNVASYLPVASIKHLRRLKLTWCAAMPNLAWTRGMNRLDFFSFVETNVEDGDLSPLMQLPALQYVGTMDKKHYNHRADKINEILKQRARNDAPNAK